MGRVRGEDRLVARDRLLVAAQLLLTRGQAEARFDQIRRHGQRLAEISGRLLVPGERLQRRGEVRQCFGRVRRHGHGPPQQRFGLGGPALTKAQRAQIDQRVAVRRLGREDLLVGAGGILGPALTM